MAAPRVVAIDGAAGSGKSTLARALARTLSLPYVNTGLMYRALAAAALREGVASDDPDRLLELTRGLRFIVRVDPPGELEVEGYDLPALTDVEVESTVSEVASHPIVRAYMRREQRDLGEAHGAVMEGRDIASVVFTDAPVKLYLSARPELRARRRAAERGAGDAGGSEQMETALHGRDARDALTNPHEPAQGATEIDTSELDAAEALEAALQVVRRQAPEMLS
jgi:cytidylate kinase